MNIEEILKKEIPNLKNYKEIWKIGFPILTTFFDHQECYLAYTIEFKARKRRFCCLVKKVKKEEIHSCLSGKNTLYHVLSSNELKLLTWTKEGSSFKTVLLEEIEELLPPKDMFLSPIFPNEINVDEILDILK